MNQKKIGVNLLLIKQKIATTTFFDEIFSFLRYKFNHFSWKIFNEKWSKPEKSKFLWIISEPNSKNDDDRR